MKRWIAILVTAMLAILQTGAFAECDDEISNYTRYADYIPQAAEPVGLIPGENHRTLVVWFSRVGNSRTIGAGRGTPGVGKLYPVF